MRGTSTECARWPNPYRAVRRAVSFLANHKIEHGTRQIGADSKISSSAPQGETGELASARDAGPGAARSSGRRSGLGACRRKTGPRSYSRRVQVTDVQGDRRGGGRELRARFTGWFTAA